MVIDHPRLGQPEAGRPPLVSRLELSEIQPGHLDIGCSV